MRVFSLAALLILFDRHPELREAGMYGPAEEDGAPPDVRWQEVTLGEVALGLLVRQLRPRSTEGNEQSRPADVQSLDDALDRLARRHREAERLHAAVTRAVYRQVLTASHDLAVQAERRSQDALLDPLGDLLLLGHLLSGVVFDCLAQTGRSESAIERDVSEVLRQQPVSEARFPIAEHLQPEHLGVEEGKTNPYRIALLALLDIVAIEGNKGSEETAGGQEARVAAYWSTDQVREILDELSTADAGPAVPLPDGDPAAEITDRFRVLFAQREAEWARSILSRLAALDESNAS